MGRRDLQGPKAAAGAPVVLPADAPAVALAAAAAAAGTASSKALGPFGFLQWGNSISNNSGSSVYWGSPIGGTLYINPSLDDAAAAAQDPVMQLPAEPARTAAATANGSSSGSSIASSDVRKGSRANKLSFLPQWDTSSSSWGSPIGGTLYINPSVDDVAPPQENTVVQLPDEPTAATGAAAAAMSTSSSSSSTLPRVPKGSKTSKLPFLPPFKWGNPSTTQWGSPMGGTLYINPQAPADWQDGWGSGFGSSSGSSGGGSGRSSSRGGASGGSIGGIGSKPGGGSYAHARAAAEANWGGVPLGMGIAKLGVALMAAFAAAAAAALFMKATPANDNNDGRTNTVTQATGSAGMTPQGRAAAAAAAAAAAGAKDLAPAAGQPVSEGGLGFHQWMVQRLQSTLDGFEAEQSMLRTEQAVLKSMGAAGASGSSAGVFGGLKRWLGSKRGDAAVATNTSSHGSGEGVQSAGGGSLAAATGAAATAANGAAATAGVAGTAGDDVAARLADIREQLESIDVLKAALSAELSEQQQLLHKAQQEQQAVQGQLAALASR
jgi:hypothetical protein